MKSCASLIDSANVLRLLLTFYADLFLQVEVEKKKLHEQYDHYSKYLEDLSFHADGNMLLLHLISSNREGGDVYVM